MAGIFLDHGWRDRVAAPRAAAALAGAWMGDPPEVRAAMAAAAGDLPGAAVIAGGIWRRLSEGDLAGALRESRRGRRTMAMALAEAEALMAAGAVVPGIRRLRDLHRAMYPPAAVALARHRHRLGDHAGAVDAALTLPGHAQAAVEGAKAALMDRRDIAAMRLLEPYLCGVAPLPDALLAGAVATVAASALARLGRPEELERLAEGLLAVRDLSAEMAPAVARVAWTAGRAAQAWEHFDPGQGAWAAAARLELALLAGDTGLAARLAEGAGALAGAARQAVELLTGDFDPPEEARPALAAGRRVHVWRTHPTRWAPWIEAAGATEAEVGCYDLAAGEWPDEGDLPDAALDDSALVELVDPRPVAARRAPGRAGVWVEPGLCSGTGIGHDWPRAEDGLLRERLAGSLAESPEAAAVLVLSAETALAAAAAGLPAVAVAPPGDPFWAGPLPGRAWPALRVERADPSAGWAGAGGRVAEAALALLEDGPGAGSPPAGGTGSAGRGSG